MASPAEPTSRPARATDDETEKPSRPPSRRRTKQPAATAPANGGLPEVILVGCGPNAQQTHIPALLALLHAGTIEMRAIVEPDTAAREWAATLFPRAQAVTSLEPVVAPPDALAVLTTPARFHAAQSNAALKRGWHVLCGTPLAKTSRDGALMIAAAQRHERLLAIDLPRRFFPAARYLRTLCHDHLLGPPIEFRIHEGTTRVAPPGAPAFGKFESPDGVLDELGLPALDLVTWWLGSPSVVSYADDAMGGVEANAFIELSFAEGARGTVHLSRDWPTSQSYMFVFERGIVSWDATGASGLTFQLGSAPSALHGELVAPLSAQTNPPLTPLLSTPEQALAAEIQNILAAIAGRESLRVPATEAMHSLSIVEECHARRTPLPQPWLSRHEAVNARAFAPPATLRRP